MISRYHSKRLWIELSGAIWLLLNLADLDITYLALQNGLTEANFFVSLGRLSFPAFAVIKTLGTLLVLAVLWDRPRGTELLSLLNIGMAVVVLWNIGSLILSA